MRKLLLIGFKDLKTIFRDRTALIFMLLAPFLLTLGMGFVTGAFNRSSTMGLSQMKILVVNQDEGMLGAALVDLLQSPDLSDLLAPEVAADPASARSQVDSGEVVAAILIPTGFTDSIIPQESTAPAAEVQQIEIYKNPLSPVSAGVVQSIVEEFLSRVETGRLGAEVIIGQMLSSGLVSPDQVTAIAAEVGERQATAANLAPAIRLNSEQSGNAQQPFNIMAYMAPGMALMFLMFTVSNGGRTILAEQSQGTLPRLMASPTSRAQVLIGKVSGVYLAGVIQMLILVVTCSLLFGLRWGDPLGVLVLILLAVFAATGWGMVITSVARTPNQVSNIGIAIMLTFSILGGSFIQVSTLPGWFQVASRITPNAWGMDGFSILALGGSLGELGTTLLGLGIMGVVLLVTAIFLFSRRNLAQK